MKYNLHFSYLICLFHSIYPELTYNKHFIRHHTSQNKAHIIPKNYSILPRQTIFNTQRPPSYHLIRKPRIPRQPLRSFYKVSLRLLPVQIRIIPLHDPPFHQKRAASRHKGCREGRPGHHRITALPVRYQDLRSRRAEIRFHLLFIIKFPLSRCFLPYRIASAGKIRILLIQGLYAPTVMTFCAVAGIVIVTAAVGRKKLVPLFTASAEGR